jgi:hypothetical protein
MRLPRMTTRLWMAAVAGAEALFSVIYWGCCNIELGGLSFWVPYFFRSWLLSS